MKKIGRIIGKHWIAILSIILLLVIQAFSELALPSYTSNIINVGIQQGGIESAVPTDIRQQELEKLLFFMTPDQAQKVKESYTADENGICKLNSVSEEEKNELNSIFGVPMMISYAMANINETSDLAFSTEGMINPDGTINIETVMEQISNIDESIVNQVAIQYVASEYKAIGLDTSAIQNNYIFVTALFMLLYSLISAAAAIINTLISSRTAAAIGMELRSAMFSRVLSFSNAEIDKLSTASLITRCTNDIQQITMTTVMILRMVLYAPIIGGGSLIKVLGEGSTLTWVIAVGVAALLLLIIVLFVVALPKFQQVQKKIDRLNLVSREILTGLPVIRAFSKEEHEKKRFDTANTDIMKINTFINNIMSFMMPMMMFIMNGVSILIVWAGAFAVDEGSMQVGDLTAFISYTMQIIVAFLMISMLSIMLPRAIISAKRVGEVLNTEASIASKENAQSFSEKTKGVVEFKNVSFHYANADEDVVSDITFTALPGQTTAIIGSTGSGKTTIANLIPRFYDVTAGEIIVDGVNVKDADLTQLRDKIGYISQKAVLFSGTIKSNIGYGNKEISQEQIETAAEISQSKEFIELKDDKYDELIAQGGTNVSGGQKQRLSIARAIAKKPDIYIFDDSFSALDYKTDVNLRKALNAYTSESTVIIVAQRISTVMNAEQILVLDDGKIVGKGTHNELMESCEVYKQIALSQLSQDELTGKEDA